MTHAPPAGAPSPWYEWTVRLNAAAQEGRSVWENCPVRPGRNVFLYVADLPPFAVRIGKNRYWTPPAPPVWNAAAAQWLAAAMPPPVNSPVVQVGVWPAPYFPLSVGCELAVLPGWYSGTLESPDQTDAAEPAFGALAGFDVRTLTAADPALPVAVWIRTINGGNLMAPRVWVRHPSGQWGRTTVVTSGAVSRTTLSVVGATGADRVTVESGISGGPSNARLQFTVGLLGALAAEANPEYFVRFGAVECPPYLQVTP